ncbi:MAG: hypothetical protein ACLR9P_01465 [Escherichia coli]
MGAAVCLTAGDAGGGVSLRDADLASQALQSDLAGTRAVQKVLKARQPQSAAETFAAA